MQMTMSSGQLICFLSGYEVLGRYREVGAMYPNINDGRGGGGVTVTAMSPKIVCHLTKTYTRSTQIITFVRCMFLLQTPP